MKQLLLIWVLPFISYYTQAQTKETTTIRFTEMWVWEYQNSNGKRSEMAIYREPKSNYWLLTADDAGFRDTDEMTLWFLLKPNGEVIQAYQDGEKQGNKKIVRHRLDMRKTANIPPQWKRQNATKYFGHPDLGFPEIKGNEYKVEYEKTEDKSVFYLAASKADFTPLNYFNNLNIDAKLPIRFPKEIPGSFMVLSENSVFPGGSVRYNFKYISQTEYFID